MMAESMAESESDTVEGQFDDAEEDNPENEKPGDSDMGDTHFCPPLYRQRYCLVASILRTENVQTVVDFGSAECKVLPIFKQVSSLEKITGVDLDRSILRSGIYLTKPLLADYLVKRSRPLTIRLLCGNIAEYDVRLHGVEAVTMIEVIEHLYPETICEVTQNIFVNIRPRIVIMTTPNSEYNVVFPDGDPGKFRHWDHKFEWTRAEFQQWCDDAASNHGYTVEYSGIGDPPPDRLDVGHCSQVALFKLDGTWAEAKSSAPSQQQPYEQIAECVHPHQQVQSLQEQVVTETNFYLRSLVKQCLNASDDDSPSIDKEKFYYSEDEDILRVSLSFLLTLTQFQKLGVDQQTLRSVLLSQDFNLTDDGQFILHTPPVEPGWFGDEEFSDDVEPVCDAYSGMKFSPQENWDV